jgi:antitoxin FitA
MDLSITGVPEEQVKRLRERAKANHRSLERELRAIIDEAIGVARKRLSVDEIATQVGALGLTRRDEAAPLISKDRDR